MISIIIEAWRGNASTKHTPYIETVAVFIADPSVHLPLADREPFEADLSKQ
jgi:hypothetical protein